MAAKLCVNIQMLKSDINKLKQVKAKLETNPLNIREKQGSGKMVDMLNETAEGYQKMYDAILDLNNQTIVYFQSVVDSLDLIETASARGARGRERER